MKRTAADSLKREYRFEYSSAKPNRFAGRAIDDRVVVALDPDVSKVFRTPEDVNGMLRALITRMPRRPGRRRTAPK